MIAAPLNALKGGKGEKVWKWESEEQDAFKAIKKAITSKPVLTLPNEEGKFRVEVDTSNVGTGAVLSQEHQGKWHPVAFMSKSLLDAEKNYKIYDKELLAIVKALKAWRQYLIHANQQFEVWTNHENLKYFREPQKLNARQARWYIMLQEYNYSLQHIPGKTNTKADILSWLFKVDTSCDNENVEMFKDRIFIRQLSELPSSLETTLLYNRHLEVSSDLSLLSHIKDATNKESSVIQEMRKRPNIIWEKDNIIYRNNKIYVLKNKEIRDKILHDHHNSPNVGHPGIHRMLELIKRTYWWPTIKTDVTAYVKGCLECQKNNIICQPGHVSLSPLPIPKQPWQEISIDMIGPLPKSDNYDSILVIVDRFSKMIHLIPTTTSLSSTKLAEIYKKEVWRQHGIPRRIISDRGPQFASKFMKELCNALGIEWNLSTAYHPQMDGQTERINQEVKAYLHAFINYRQNDWSKWLPTAEFQYNDKVHYGTKHSPFFLNYGLHPWKGTLSTTTPNPSANNFTWELIKVHDEAKTALQSYNGNMKDRGSDRRPKEKFMPGTVYG
jgi:hypothetical protein